MTIHLVLYDGDRRVDSWDVDPRWDATDVAEFTTEVGTDVYDYIRDYDESHPGQEDRLRPPNRSRSYWVELLSYQVQVVEGDATTPLRRNLVTEQEFQIAVERWIEVTQQLDEIGHQLGRIKEQYGELKYPAEIESLAELEPVDRRKRELAAREHDLRGQSCRLGNEQAKLDDLIRSTLPINVWYRVNGHRLRWISERHATPRLVYEELTELEMAA